MKKSKGVYVTRRDMKENRPQTEHEVYAHRITDREIPVRYGQSTHDVGCQINSERDNLICTCKNVLRKQQEVRYFSGYQKQVYRYHKSRSFTDIGVGSVKALQKKKVKRIYLPETDDRGVGSSDLSSFINRRTRYSRGGSYYDNKRTSSKCVGGIKECAVGLVVNKKLSPLIQMRSGTTSPKIQAEVKKNNEIGSNTNEKHLTTITTQVEELYVTKDSKVKSVNALQDSAKPQAKENNKQVTKDKIHKLIATTSTTDKTKWAINKRVTESTEKVFSSDSLVQHIHNLEDPSVDKQSRLSVDLIENKLEREYRKMFATKTKEQCLSTEKPIPDFKSASILRRRFEALRRGIAKKEDSKKNAVVARKELSQSSVPSRKDVSVDSDPPSLEGRSYSNTKTYSPFISSFNEVKVVPYPEASYKKSFVSQKEKECIEWPRTQQDDSDEQGVKGMFKLWGKKFNFEEENDKKILSPDPSYNTRKKYKEPAPQKVPIKAELDEKKEGRKFFFFKKKSKDKTKQPYKSKKGVTTGRCEVRDGLMIKIGAPNGLTLEETKENILVEKKSVDYEDVLRKAWLQNILSESIEPRKSVHIRWNNKMYATSSSTVFELMDSVYKQTGVILKSRSEITTGNSSYRSFTKEQVNFIQNIEAWMIPKTIPNRQTNVARQSEKDDKNNIKVTISDQKWFLDSSKAFSHKIEVVLRSKNFVKVNKYPSSEYLRIDIPKGFFSDSASDSGGRTQTSNEEVYKIVEYETPDSKTGFKLSNNVETAKSTNDINVTVSIKNSKEHESKIVETVIKRPPIYRDVVIQGSNVAIPKRCDVISVGIITQRDIRDIRKPILKIQDDYSDEELEHSIDVNQMKCEFAESYLQDYYRHCPLGTDLFSWCVRDSHLGCCSDKSYSSINNESQMKKKGDSVKSCPNIYDDFQASTIQVSSCATSSCSNCQVSDEQPKEDDNYTSKLFSKFKRKIKSEPTGRKRVLPKDSFEVFKKRKLYAASNKSKWSTYDNNRPYSVPSIEDKEAQDTFIDKIKKSCWKPNEAKPKKKLYQKHVSLPDCEDVVDKLASQLSIRQPEGILSFKGAGCDICKKKGLLCTKHANINPIPSREIPQPPCKPSCEKMKNPPCFKSSTPSCVNVPAKTISSSRPHTPPRIPSAPPIKTPSYQHCPPCQPLLPPSPRLQSPLSTPQIQKKIKNKKSPAKSNKSPSPPPCPTPKYPCDPCMKSPSQEFPWPMKNQISNQPSLDSCISVSSKSGKRKSNKKLNKPNINKKPSSSPPKTRSKSKMSGIFFKMKPSIKKSFSKENCPLPRCISLPSGDKILIRIKKDTLSTKEIREGLNIKVQDADGQTLYERRDYTNQQCSIHKPSVLGDMYKDSCVNRVTTPNTANVQLEEKANLDLKEKSNADIDEVKNEVSIANLIEIHFKLKLTQGDKTTEINIGNDNNVDNEKMEMKNQMGQTPLDVFISKDENPAVEDLNAKNDINIQIVFKNYKQQGDKKCKEQFNVNDEYSNKISEKFHTVSTGYSDVLDQNDNALSIHRTAVDLTSSTDKSKLQIKPSEEIMIQELTEKPIATSKKNSSAKQICSEESIKGKTVEVQPSLNKKGNQNLEIENPKDNEEIQEDKSETRTSITDTDREAPDINNTSDDQNINNNSTEDERSKPVIKENKKELLKKIFEMASINKGKKKSRMKQLKNILKVVLTSDGSDIEEKAVTSNELVNDVTYASLKPNYFRDTDSMNNYYKMDSTAFMSESESNMKPIYPTVNHSEDSTEIDSSDDESKKAECLCTTVAARLNMCKMANICDGCCCHDSYKKSKLDQETNCDLRTDVDLFLLNYKTAEYIDVETQISKFCSKVNSIHISVEKVKSNDTIDHLLAQKMSNDIKLKDDKATLQRTSSPHMNHIKECKIKRLHQNPMLGISDEEKIVVIKRPDVCLQTKITRSSKRKKKYLKDINESKPADILQSYETKKAVLEIYTEKTVTHKGERLVAKLPKFLYGSGNNFERNYSEIVSSYNSISKHNFIMMSTKR
ncbi:uncharacterized protein ACR2FA_010732 [Aphomia sociella]